ncbi:hypothetical protein ACQFX9_14310 [Aliinostoc sp. HNIBRCY26]|uniref:hypothetical protein n=1 Tax=Aliinostoc sp. HNIBRCY26 TaxID=3418997 RepID=UPI003D01D3EB
METSEFNPEDIKSIISCVESCRDKLTGVLAALKKIDENVEDRKMAMSLVRLILDLNIPSVYEKVGRLPLK